MKSNFDSSPNKEFIKEDVQITLNSPKKLSYVVDPVNDTVMQKTYLTKFRMSNIQKFKILADRRKKLNEISSNVSKLSKNAKKVVFDQEKLQVMELSVDKESENNSVQTLSEDSDTSIEQESQLHKLLNHKRKFNEEISSFTPHQIIIDNLTAKQDDNEPCLKLSLPSDSPLKFVDKTADNLEEVSEDNEDDKKISDDEELSNFSNDDNEDLEEVNDFDFDDNDIDIDAYEGQELEDDEEFEDFDEMLGDDMAFNKEDFKKMTKRQQMFLAQIFMPPDFKKDLFKKDPNDQNEVDYKSLQEAMDNSLQNMKTLKLLKSEFQKKKNKGVSSINRKEKKVKFEISNNKTKNFDKNKVILLDSNRKKILPILPAPTTGCLKK